MSKNQRTTSGGNVMKTLDVPAIPISCAVSPQPASRRAVAEHLARLDAFVAAGEAAKLAAASVRVAFKHYACPGIYNEDYGRRMGCGVHLDEDVELCAKHQAIANSAARAANDKYFEENEEYGW